MIELNHKKQIAQFFIDFLCSFTDFFGEKWLTAGSWVNIINTEEKIGGIL
jgi:hypothetical protein